MGYYSFLFWFTWRLLLAILAHVNWFTALYVKCIYFSLWKSYDLLWFWMHLLLCICFEPLRSENYLLVWCNLMHKKCTTKRHKSFRQIYNESYNRRFTKSERELKRIEIEEANDSDDEENGDSDSRQSKDSSAGAGGSGSGGMYPQLNVSDRPDGQAMPSINVSRKPNAKGTSVNFQQRAEGEALIRNANGENVDGTEDAGEKKAGVLSKIKIPKLFQRKKSDSPAPKTPDSDTSETSKWSEKIGRFVPSALHRSGNSEDDVEAKAAAAKEKEAKKEEKRQKKEQMKAIRQRRKEFLREQAKIERRRRLISDAIELLLQCLRLFTTFAMLVGNIHKTFMPSYIIGEERQLWNPDVFMVFTITMGLDMMLFWMMSFLTYYKQCRLCCRMGICRFWGWLAALILFGGFGMYYPMHMAHEQLDMTWCKFEVGTPLSEVFY
ncbi:Protein F59F4.3 [Aphelenchoides fujianensis]|nr:Protein F59F4.3 [Aphelenchoides fujianensis]